MRLPVGGRFPTDAASSARYVEFLAGGTPLISRHFSSNKAGRRKWRQVSSRRLKNSSYHLEEEACLPLGNIFPVKAAAGRPWADVDDKNPTCPEGMVYLPPGKGITGIPWQGARGRIRYGTGQE